MESIFWKGYTNNERHFTIDCIQNIIAKYGAITEFKMFSDLEINLKIEVQENKVNYLFQELNSALNMEYFPELKSQRSVERIVFINISFLKGGGNLKIEVPAIPG